MATPTVPVAKNTTGEIQWQCSADITSELTVGVPFTLTCAGEAVELKRETLNLRRPKENPYALRILKIDELGPTQLKVTATTYVAGESPIEVGGYAFTDGERTVELAPFTLNTKSIITQENNPEGKPYAPFAPVGLSYPLWIWITLAVLVAAIIGLILRFWMINQQRKAFLKELSEKSTSLGAYHQFQKDLRQITRFLPVGTTDQNAWNAEKALESVKSLESSYQWFLAREFKVPAHKWSANLVHREIRKQDRKLYRHAEKHLQLAQRELQRALQNSARLSVHDYQQVLEIVRKSADVIYVHRQGERLR